MKNVNNIVQWIYTVLVGLLVAGKILGRVDGSWLFVSAFIWGPLAILMALKLYTFVNALLEAGTAMAQRVKVYNATQVKGMLK